MIDVDDAIRSLDDTARELEHWAFAADRRDRVKIEAMRETVLYGVKALYEQDNIIKALMGEYGDSCDVDNGCSKEEG